MAAAERLHTAQPSLSRQIRDLEAEVGVPLLVRSVRGIELTPAGRAFLDHARLALSQAEAAVEAARRAARPAKPSFALGFLTGQEMDWLPGAMHILRDELPKIDINVSSASSPLLADALMRGRADLAFMRRESPMPGLVYKLVTREPLRLVLPGDHRLASRKTVDIRDIAGETFIGMSRTAPSLQATIEDYFDRRGLDIRAAHEADNLSMAISLVASTRGVTVLPDYARNFLPRSVISRPLKGDPPTIDLVMGYREKNASPVLKLFLARSDAMIAQFATKARPGSNTKG